MKIESNLKRGESVLEKSRTFIADHITTLFILVAVAALIIYRFCDPKMMHKITELTSEIAVDFAISFVFVMTIWSNMMWSGKQYGKKTHEYNSARVYFTSIYDTISKADKLKEVGSFVPDYIAKRLNDYQKSTVKSAGIEYEDFLKHYQHMNPREIKALEYKPDKEPKEGFLGEKLTKRQKAHIIAALKAKPITLTEDKLISGVNKKYNRNVVGHNEGELTAFGTASKAVRWTIMTAITTLYGFENFDLFASGSIGDIMLILGVITMALVSGWLKGYKIITSGVVRNLTQRADILKVMCEWYNITTEKNS